jgi:hypothetical protein
MRKVIAVLILGLFAIKAFAAEDCEDKPACHKAGCYGQICTDQDLVYACPLIESGQSPNQCYAAATCERQKDGECGWVVTKKLNSCLKKHPVP